MRERIQRIIFQQTGIDPEMMGIGDEFLNAYGLDSLDLINLVMNLEQGFDIKIPDQDLSKITTYENTISYIKSRQAEAQAAFISSVE
jgi:acyl carrier protein